VTTMPNTEQVSKLLKLANISCFFNAHVNFTAEREHKFPQAGNGVFALVDFQEKGLMGSFVIVVTSFFEPHANAKCEQRGTA